MKYFVIADNIAGQFDCFPCAKIFKNAYNEYYKAHAYIVDQSKLY